MENLMTKCVAKANIESLVRFDPNSQGLQFLYKSVSLTISQYICQYTWLVRTGVSISGRAHHLGHHLGSHLLPLLLLLVRELSWHPHHRQELQRAEVTCENVAFILCLLTGCLLSSSGGESSFRPSSGSYGNLGMCQLMMMIGMVRMMMLIIVLT